MSAYPNIEKHQIQSRSNMIFVTNKTIKIVWIKPHTGIPSDKLANELPTKISRFPIS